MQYFTADDTIELLYKCSLEWYVVLLKIYEKNLTFFIFVIRKQRKYFLGKSLNLKLFNDDLLTTIHT